MKSRYIDNDDNWKAVQPIYASDPDIIVKGQQQIQTADGTTIHTNSLLTSVVDQSTNQHSNIYLSRVEDIGELIGLKTNVQEYPFSYITYFSTSYGWSESVDPNAKCWYVKDTTATQEDMQRSGMMLEFGFDRDFSEMGNEMLFKVELLSDKLMRVSHWDTYKMSFLTADKQSKLISFDFENTSPIDEHNPQVFNYNLSRNLAVMNMFIAIDGVYHEMNYVPELHTMKLVPSTDPLYIPTTFKNAKIAPSTVDIPLSDSWVSYTTGFDQNNVNINPDKSYNQIQHNFLLNTQYVYDDNKATSHFNILPLKNHITNELQQSRNSPFPEDSETMFRDYTSVSTGGNQELGHDNIYMSFSDYTSLITLESDKLTYFHTPQSMYPYDRLNINDAGLISSGAIAGDQPVRSDKVWKKRANYTDHSNWGNALDEQSGEYLCSWLYWSGISGESPKWLDRYYNPRNYTVVEALSVKPIVQFISTFDNMNLDNPSTSNYAVYDKTSDLCFEPSNLYCYHRVGESDINFSISKLDQYKIQQDFDVYLDSTGVRPPAVFDDSNKQEYNFDGRNYASTSTLNALRDRNEISYNFSMYSSDWSDKFGYQIMGNYSDYGIGVYNDQFITPVLTLPGSASRVCNTDLHSVANIDISSDYMFHNYISNTVYMYNSERGGTVYECSMNGIINERTVIPQYGKDDKVTPLKAKHFYHNDKHLYIYYSADMFISVNLMTERVEKYGSSNIEHISTPGDTSLDIKSCIVIDEMMYTSNASELLIDIEYNLWWIYKECIWWREHTTGLVRKYIESTDYIFRSIVSNEDNSLSIIYREHMPEVVYEPATQEYNYLYDYYIMKMSRDRQLIYDINMTDAVPSLSALGPHDDIIVNKIRQYRTDSVATDMHILTDYLSTWSQEVSGLNVEFNKNMTNCVTISDDGTSTSQRLIDTPISTWSGLSSNYNLVKSKLHTSQNIITFRIKLNNTYDRDQFEVVNCDVDVSDLDPGWHHFAYDYNSHLGKLLVFVNGELISNQSVIPDMYKFAEFNVLSMNCGKATFENGVFMSDYLLQPGSYMSSKFKIKNLYVYNKSVNYYDMKYFFRQLGSINDIKWTIPSDSRNYIDEIQHVFKHRLPYVKTTDYSIDILCSAIQNKNLMADLETDIKIGVTTQSPINTQVTNVRWYGTDE